MEIIRQLEMFDFAVIKQYLNLKIDELKNKINNY